MIIGIGIDLVFTENIDESRKVPGFLSRVFSNEEYHLSNESLAGRFAAREALYKALDRKDLFDFKFVNVVLNKTGQPEFVFCDKLAEHLSSKSIHLSISHTQGFAIAFVTIES